MRVADHCPADEHGEKHADPCPSGDDREDPVWGREKPHLGLILRLSDRGVGFLSDSGERLWRDCAANQAKLEVPAMLSSDVRLGGCCRWKFLVQVRFDFY